MEKIHISLKKQLSGSGETFELQINLSLESGSLGAIYGKSGAGKTTLLRMLAGLTSPESGRIQVGEKLWYDSAGGLSLPPQKREVAFLFQDYALFPHLTVRGNLHYGLSRGESTDLLEYLLEVMGLQKLQNRTPPTLSGGEKQRVALARALVRKPKLLLLDEPLSALDDQTRLALQEEILKLHHHFQTTTLLVSHDLPEVFRLAEKVYVLEGGEIQREGPPEKIFLRSSVSGKFRFVGQVVATEMEEPICLVTVIVGSSPVKVVVTQEEGRGLNIGDQVVLFSKAFHPMVIKKV